MTRGGSGSRSRIRRPKLRIVNRPTPATITTTMPTTNRIRTAGGSPFRKLQKPTARPRIAMAKMSRMRSMKTVPNVRLSDAGLFILSRYPR